MALHLPVNAECNIQCVFCSAAGRSGDFSLPTLKAAVDADRTGHVQISGGDPLLKDPAELLALLALARLPAVRPGDPGAFVLTADHPRRDGGNVAPPGNIASRGKASWRRAQSIWQRPGTPPASRLSR